MRHSIRWMFRVLGIYNFDKGLYLGKAKSFFWTGQYIKLSQDSIKYIPTGRSNMFSAGVSYRPYNPSKWEADIWGWLEVRRSAIIYYTVNQYPHWAWLQYGHTGGTQGRLGVERWQLCLWDTYHSAKCRWRAEVGPWVFIGCVQCCRMVDSVPIRHSISIL